ncbi:uncharacterized protein LOC116348344 [Contarinia nasturtii]|uniref:uncharacterized protein LOC116348344 n=1 Tax=Contarinia nasturtii TaxID=265458 RepID=UPI0012D41030|nr:uncharacterized protein LOC116348344 [Contarinia nasturtii]
MQRWKAFFKGEKTDRTIHVIRFESLHEKRSYMQSAYKCFKRFGSVHTIRTACVDCLFIQYKDAKDAAKVLKISQIEIDHIRFRILPADKFHDQITGCCTHHGHIFTAQTNNLVTIIKDSSKNILNDLNDDCLRQIFRNIHSLVDFCTVANVCKRFNAIGVEIFSLKINQKTFALSELNVNGDDTLLRLELFLTMFGASVQAAHLNFNDLHFGNTPNAENLALKMINNYCKNLRSLSIFIGCNENKINWMEIHSVLPMLKYLKIHLHHKVIKVDLLTDFIAACCMLETMIIDCGWDFQLILPEITFPKLVKFKLPNFIYPQLDRFLRHNTQLERINCFSFDHVRFIGLNMLNLRKLTLQGGRTVEDDVLNSKSLNKNVKIKLENLFTDGRDIGYVCQLKNITTIWAEVWAPFRANHLISLAKSQKELKKLTLYILDPKIKYPIDMIKSMLSYADKLVDIIIVCGNGLRIQFNEKDFDEILKVLERRHNSINLNIKFTNSSFLSGKWHTEWEKEKIIIFNDKSNRLNVISHYIMPRSYY